MLFEEKKERGKKNKEHPLQFSMACIMKGGGGKHSYTYKLANLSTLEAEADG